MTTMTEQALIRCTKQEKRAYKKEAKAAGFKFTNGKPNVSAYLREMIKRGRDGYQSQT